MNKFFNSAPPPPFHFLIFSAALGLTELLNEFEIFVPYLDIPLQEKFKCIVQ